MNMNLHHPMVQVRVNNSNGQNQLHALKAFKPGEIICPFGAREILDYPTYLTVQVGIDKHILLDPEILQYCNHSCQPNVFFDTAAMQVFALEQISTGQELTFFYPSTEWSMAQPFECYCGTPGCLNLIEGAAYLPAETLSRYRLTEFVLQQMKLRAQPVIA
jgi:hypothetical protein